jgi:hypothetical protein
MRSSPVQLPERIRERTLSCIRVPLRESLSDDGRAVAAREHLAVRDLRRLHAMPEKRVVNAGGYLFRVSYRNASVTLTVKHAVPARP